jgi:hypothetical protein
VKRGDHGDRIIEARGLSLRDTSSFPTSYSPFFPSARTLAHLALAAALSFALTAGLLRPSFFLAAFSLAERILRALANAFTSLRRWAAVM